jgi:uncharacterized lipoprotein YehR (DUF1307 family)
MKTNRNALNKLTIAALTVFTLVLSLTGCGSQSIGYGVVLWSDNEQVLPTGSIVPVLESSSISNTYTIMTPGTSRTATDSRQKPRKIQIAQWRISFHKTKEEADAFEKSFTDFRNVYARSERNALPIRSEANPSADMLYKLRQGEVIKVLARSQKPVNESGLEAYWYRVVTGTGVTGWVFGYLLTVYDQGTGQTPPVAQTAQDPLVTLIMDTTWRPTYFSQMINSGVYDLKKFNSRYGFFSDPEQKRFNLVLPDYSIAFDYTTLQQMERNRYQAMGTSLLITVRNGNELSLQYSYKGNIVSTVFERVDQNIDDLVKAEQKRRDDLYKTFLANGDSLTSDAYGMIRFAPDKSFNWTGFEPLVPDVIPSTAEGTGTVSFPYYLSGVLQNKFDGVITFALAGTGKSATTSFLYSFASGGIRLEYVPPTDIKNDVVLRESFSPTIIFFKQAKSGS